MGVTSVTRNDSLPKPHLELADGPKSTPTIRSGFRKADAGRSGSAAAERRPLQPI